jgi:protein-tyrosine phosphatase
VHNITVWLLVKPREAEACEAQGIQFLSFPIEDRGTPRDVAATSMLVAQLHRAAMAGGGIVIHCRAGIGRSGLIAASVLLNEGLSPSEAFSLISKARRVPVPDTEEQIRWVQGIPLHTTRKSLF